MIPAPLPLPWLQMFQTAPSTVSPLWQGQNVPEYLRDLKETIELLKAVHQELEILSVLKGSNEFTEELSESHASELTSILGSGRNSHASQLEFCQVIKMKRINLHMQETLSLEAASALLSTLKSQLVLFNVVTDDTTPWEERSVAVKLANKLHKSRRNKRWRKRKGKRVAEMLSKEHGKYDKADQDADEWRAREIAKDIAKSKVEKMKAIAKLKANEERKRLESELELVLIVEKLQELRSIRIHKLKKQGHFLPEEDDKFLERVRAAVEEEERQAAVAADTDAAKDAIASAEESRKAVKSTTFDLKDVNSHRIGEDQVTEKEGERSSAGVGGGDAQQEPRQRGLEGWGCGGAYDSVATLPAEFYHYYHGSNTDMGTLIEVRRRWDAYLRPGGSRIPGHWVQPPSPADEIWASCLVSSNNASKQ